MDSSKVEDEIVFDFPPMLRTYKSGRVERLLISNPVPPSFDPSTGVTSKDVLLIPETGVSARFYLPKIADKKLPLLVYFHGGAFCVGSAFSPTYHSYLNSLVGEAKVVCVLVEYRLAPEHPLPAAYEDSWAALQWVATHSTGDGPEAWLNEQVDFGQVYLAGDSAGANIAHNMAMWTRDKPQVPGFKLTGAILVHPFFAGVEPVGSEVNNLESKAKVEKSWLFLSPSSTGCDDPLINPFLDNNLAALGCDRVLVCVAEKDQFRDRGWLYSETLRKNGWGGVVEFMKSKGEQHVFHLFNPNCENAVLLMERLASFINQDYKSSS